MSVHSKNWWAARKAAETAYASGAGTNAFDQTKLSALVGMAYPKSFSNDMYPYQKIKRDDLESQDDGIYGSEKVDSGWESKEGSRDEYVQDAFYLDKIIAQIAAGQGSVPISYALHWQDHIRAGSAADNLRYESFGCFPKELTLTIPKNDGTKETFPYWTIKDACYSTKYDKGSGSNVDSIVKVAWLTIASAPISTKASYTIGGQAVNGIEGSLTIKVNWDENKEAGDDGLKYPYFLNVEIEFTAKFRNYTKYKAFVENLLLAKASETKYTIKITSGIASTFPQITNMQVVEGDLNRIPEKGMVSYDITFKNTNASVLTKETS